ncbi:expressed unknown protein [Seminavis robusta]|uniref:Uncharacterized protein n=1 Tax=Seminavis robusta TaxID=568900 RepID=A0A9N8DG10_9STRA|nr:expressed unknown protein [Seminavis robusta]|eukprot:Sro70_g039090.1 n/a (215) ;mRNA; f:110591-111355
MLLREPYQFIFKGYSIWLEVEQQNGDLDNAIQCAASEKSLFPIPDAHCTVLYGATHLSEREAMQCFRDKVVPLLERRGGWPSLKPKCSNSGVAFDGVDGEEMDMSWMELSFHSSEAHEAMVDSVYSCFYGGSKRGCVTTERIGPWLPHVSIAYDSPEDTVLDEVYTAELFDRIPSLLSKSCRDVVGISLWRTEGKLWDWECLDRVSLLPEKKAC